MMSTLRKKRSPVWNHFEEKGDGGHAKCKICSASLKFDGNPSNLKKHLTTMHPTVDLSSAEDIKKREAGGITPPKQMKIDSSFKYAPTSKRQLLITEKVVEMICEDLQPLSIVENIGFQNLLKTMDPRYALPSRRTITKDISTKYDEIASSVKEALKKADAVCLTTDLWTSRAGHGYIGVTAHIMDEWKMKTFILCTEHFTDDHTGENIAKTIKEIANRWEIQEKIALIVTDSAASMLLAMRLLPWPSIPCMAHIINLVVCDARTKDEEFDEVVKKAKDVVTFFHHSTKAMVRLTEQQGFMNLPQHSLKQDVATRWNSTLEMLESVIEQFDAIHAVLGVLKRTDLCFNDDGLRIMKEAVIVLQPMQKLTTILSGEAYTTISSVIPLVKGLRKMMEAVQGGRELLKKELLVQIEKRLGRCEEKDRLAYATLFDPRYKKSCFKDPLLLQKHVQAVTNEIANRMKVMDHIPDKSNQETCQQSAEKPTSDGHILDFLDDIEPVIATPNYKSQAIVEMDGYLNLQREERSTDPLDYWRRNTDRFPNIAALAKRYLSAPATSVPCERLFSTAGDLLTEKRSRLSPDNVNKILFLSKNLKNV